MNVYAQRVIEERIRLLEDDQGRLKSEVAHLERRLELAKASEADTEAELKSLRAALA